MVAALFECLTHYKSNPGIGPTSVRIENYFRTWRDLHQSAVNISEKGWNALIAVMQRLGLPSQRENADRFLFCVESYLDALMKVVALNRMGNTIRNGNNLNILLQNSRSVFPSNVLEWYFDALADPGLPANFKNNVRSALDLLSVLVDQLDFSMTTFDVFRVIYQNILPREVRRSLGEFYTNENIINEVIDAVAIDQKVITTLFERWQKQRNDTVILDPTCGSGSFLVVLIKKIASILRSKGAPSRDVLGFVQDSVVGIDVNPFAVDMARLNYILAVMETLKLPPPVRIQVYWADSLARVTKSQFLASKILHLSEVNVPSFSLITGGPLKVPDSAEFYDAERLIQDIYGFIERGQTFNDFSSFLATNPPNTNVAANLSDFASTLRLLYQDMEKVHATGNSRLVGLIGNSVKITDLKGRCAFVVGNPPWVRIHEIARQLMTALVEQFESYKETYNPRFVKTVVPSFSQFDYSMAFVEAGIEYLSDTGHLGFVITSKIGQALYAGGLRKKLANLRFLRLIDHSYNAQKIFYDVTNYPLIFSISKNDKPAQIPTTVYNTKGDKVDFTIQQKDLPLYSTVPSSPWVIAPPPVLEDLRRLQKSGPTMGNAYEVVRGVVTSLNEAFVVATVRSSNGGVAQVELEDGSPLQVEEDVLCPLVRGESVDRFAFQVTEYIIFPHDQTNAEVLIDPQQEAVLKAVVESRPKKSTVTVRASGSVMVCEIASKYAKVLSEITNKLSGTFHLIPVTPCGVNACYDVQHGGRSVLLLSLEDAGSKCRVYINGLRIPSHPLATAHFMSHLGQLAARTDYKPGDAPWEIFRIPPEKLRTKVAWQEIAPDFEACLLPASFQSVGGHLRPLIPNQKVYFVHEPDPVRAAKLALYLNHPVAEAFVKLVASKLRKGFIEHISSTVGHLPIPSSLFAAWNGFEKNLSTQPPDQVNQFLANSSKSSNLIIDNAIEKNVGSVSELVNYSEWLNSPSESR